MDLRRAWMKFVLVVTGCAVGGFGLGTLIAAKLADGLHHH